MTQEEALAKIAHVIGCAAGVALEEVAGSLPAGMFFEADIEVIVETGVSAKITLRIDTPDAKEDMH